MLPEKFSVRPKKSWLCPTEEGGAAAYIWLLKKTQTQTRMNCIQRTGNVSLHQYSTEIHRKNNILHNTLNDRGT